MSWISLSRLNNIQSIHGSLHGYKSLSDFIVNFLKFTTGFYLLVKIVVIKGHLPIQYEKLN